MHWQEKLAPESGVEFKPMEPVSGACVGGLTGGCPTDLHIYNLDAVPPIHVISNHVDTDKLTTANGGTFTSILASHSSQITLKHGIC